MDKRKIDDEIEQNNSESLNNSANRCTDLNDIQHFLLPSGGNYTAKYSRDYVKHSGVARYNHALKNLIPLRTEKPIENTTPADNAGLFSHIFMSWMTQYLWKAYKKGLTLKDLPQISTYDTADYNAQRLDILWQKELNRHGTDASLTKVAWRFVRTRVCVACTLLSCSILFGFLSPAILMRNLLEYMQAPDGTLLDGLKWVILLALSDFLRTTFFTWTWVTNYKTALRLKTAYATILYKKIIKLNNFQNKSKGEIITLFANDSHRMFDVVLYGPMIISGPIVTVLGIIYILWLFSPIALLGMISFLLFYPCQYFISRLSGYFRSKTVQVTDARVRLMNEILECIKLVKMYAWEKHFSKSLLDVRKKEKSWLHKSAYFQSLSLSLTPAMPMISAIVTFLAHVSSGSNLTAAQAFPITSFFGNLIRLALVGLKDSTRYFVEAIVAFRRYKVFPFISLLSAQIRSLFMFLQVALINIAESKITLNRLKSVLVLDETNCIMSKPIVKSQAVAIANGTFVCDNIALETDAAKDLNNKKETRHTLSNENKLETEKLSALLKETKYVEILGDINFEAPKEKLIGICGSVGSGKSSLLLAILGQLRMTKGHMSREGSCAYVSQQAWIVNATLKENILFGEQCDAKRYYQTLSACSLKEDLDMLPGGDETEIGERGINLSGGQKQRVALARALYANRDIYLLDDPLSAVDPHVASYIFENLILGALKSKTIIFVTHQIQFLKHSSCIYMLNCGKIIESGTHEELIQLNREYALMVTSTTLQAERDASKREQDSTVAKLHETFSENVGVITNSRSDSEDESNVKHRDVGGKILTVEDKAERGTVKLNTYLTYVKAAGGYFVAAFVFLMVFLNVGSSAFSTWWLAVWINAGGGNTTLLNGSLPSQNINDNPDFEYYQTIYASCIGAILITSFLRGLTVTYTTINAATVLHNRVFQKMIGSSLKFFETTPSGRIQNIFSRDIDEVDNYLPIAIESMIQNIIHCSICIFLICWVFPWFIIPLIFLGALFFCVSTLFRVAIRDLKRMESMSRAPLLSFVTTTIQGLSTIHAFEKEKSFVSKFEELMDLNNLCMHMCQAGMRWSAARLDILAICSTFVTALLIAFLKGQISPALAGLALAYSAQMSGVFQYTVRLMSETEARFISVERINYYIRTLEKEGGNKNLPIQQHNSWLTSGKIEFANVCMNYRKELPFVLIDISFIVKAGEKLGIVGRTGSGKTSLIVALFRLVDVSVGTIKIDDVDISNIDLEVLRRKLSIIPQDPILFSGTIRSNLDPFQDHADSIIWDALEKTQLKEKVKAMIGQLDASVGFGGNNLSVGERQLLCLTRALLRNSQVLVLDEATAAVDPETEAAVQNTIKSAFTKSTVITIAHRLQTVMSCDRILVMSNGRVVELDTITALLSNPNSRFAKMMTAAEKAIQ